MHQNVYILSFCFELLKADNIQTLCCFTWKRL